MIRIATVLFALFTQLSFAQPIKEVQQLYSKIEGSESREKELLSYSQIKEVFLLADTNKVAQIPVSEKYDPKGEIGFNFGTAMNIHLSARKMGIKPELIRKVFILGNLESEKGETWRFHVATAIHGLNAKKEREWFVLDPLMTDPIEKELAGVPLPLSRWVSNLRTHFDKKKKAVLYLTDPSAITPNLSRIPLAAEDEKGELADCLMGLGFNPEKSKHFEKTTDLIPGETVYLPTEEGLTTHFAIMGKRMSTTSFNTNSISGKLYSDGKESPYKIEMGDYFKDMVREIDAANLALGRNATGTEIHGTEIHKGPKGPKLTSPSVVNK